MCNSSVLLSRQRHLKSLGQRTEHLADVVSYRSRWAGYAVAG